MSNKGVSMSNEMNLPLDASRTGMLRDSRGVVIGDIFFPDKAAHIVKCVNAHESLVAAAQAVVDVTDQEGYCGPETIGYAIEALRAALAKAQGDGK